jgi:hypothetical protein
VKLLRWLSSIACVLSLCPSLASADEPNLGEWVQTRVQGGLVKPMVDNENHRFSRARPPPRERRVRATDTTATIDKNGRSFVRFAVDVRFGSSDWKENDIVGCAYLGSGDLYVKRGEAYRPASFLLGKNEDPVPGVCEAAPARS